MDSTEFEPLLDKIIASKSFGNSITYANLFRYLVNCTLTDDIPKETTIATDIFGKSNFDPSQSTLVRVYVYNLRKKLAKYYANEGERDEKIIRIPKGSYRVVLEKRSSHSVRYIKSRNWIIGLLAVLLLSIMTNIYLSSSRKNEASINIYGLWSDLVHSERNIIVVLGDLFVYTEQDSAMGITRTIRNPTTNSLMAFNQFKSTHNKPGVTIEPLSYSFLIQGSVHWIRNLTEVFFSQGKDYTIRTMNRFNPKELPNHDFMVIGMIKTWGIFNAYFKNSDFEYDIDQDALLYHKGNGEAPTRYVPQGNADAYHTDYGILAKFPGPNDNVIYLFGGLWDTGATQSIKHFTDPKLLQDLERALKDKFGEIPEYYEVLLEVSGVDRMELSSKIVHLSVIENSKGVWEVDL
ncbi:MAG: hypothetical protein AAFX53_15785 [Bacteroidota bacterium]